MMPPSFVVMLQRQKPVAIFCSSVGFGSKSPASCSIDELIERHVLVERADDPIAIGPDLAVVVEVNAVRVGIAGHIEPVAAAMLAPVLRLHQPIDQLLVGIRRLVVDERFDQRRLRRQARQIETEPAGERPAVGFRRGRQAGRFQLGQNERIDRVLHPGRVLHRRRRRPRRRNQRPVRLILGPFGDPLLERLLLRGGQLLLRRRRRHHRIGIGRKDPRDDGAFAGLARHDRVVFDGDFALVEPQIGLSRGAIRPVTGKAVLGQDRPDVAVVLELVRSCGAWQRHGSQENT